MAREVKGYCSVCTKSVRHNQQSLRCSICKFWLHLKCTSLSTSDYDKSSKPSENWYCHLCLPYLFPFNSADDDLEFETNIFNFQHVNKLNCNWLRGSNQLKIINTSITGNKSLDPDNNLIKSNYKSSQYFTDSEFNDYMGKYSIANDNFSILHINARSLTANLNSLLYIIANLSHQFSVIAISEVWANDSNISFLSSCIPGYNCYIKPRTAKRGGGTAIFVKDCLTCCHREDLTALATDELEIAAVEINGLSTRTVVAAVYRPPNTDITAFNDQFSKLLSCLVVGKTKCYLAGDFNIDLLKIDKHTETQTFLDNSLAHFIYPTITQATHYTRDNQTLIDNILTNNINEHYLAGVLVSDISDHLPVFYISYNSMHKQSHYETFVKTSRAITQTNIDKFAGTLSSLQWKRADDFRNVNEFYNYFIDNFKLLYDKCFPIVTHKSREKLNGHKPWISSAIITSTRRKNILYKKWLKTKTEASLAKYKSYRNKLTQTVRAAEKLYYTNKFEKLKDDLRGTWNIIKAVINGSSTTSHPLEIIDNGNVITDPSKVAGKFNKYFVNIGPNLAKTIDKPREGHFSDYVTSSSSSMYLTPVDSYEIYEIFHSFNSNKSCGYDEVSLKVVNAVFRYICEPLTEICNLSFVSGIFPDKLKIAKVTPIYKSDDKKVISNYRPISVLPIFSKLLEKLMHKRLLAYLTTKNILVDNQYGFREKHSTYMGILNLIDQVTEAIDNRSYVLGIFIDLSKAFDTINHSILLEKLRLYGIRGTVWEWFKSYLERRSQFVQIGTSKSDVLNITCGVPQGSILGPLLFVLYINDIVNASALFHMIMFADDTNLFLKGRDLNNLISKSNEELAKMSVWFKLNMLSLNIKKTNFIIFRSKNKRLIYDSDIKIDNVPVTNVQKTKFLGVIINQSLTWSDHIAAVKQKVAKSVGIIYRIRKNMPKSVLVSSYHTLVHPYLEYCNIVWGIHRSAALSQLFICQKKAIRAVTFSKWNCHTAPLFKQLNVLPVHCINDMQVGCFVYRSVNKLLPNHLCKMFVMNSSVHTYGTRTSEFLHVCQHRLTLSKHSVRCFGSSLWNSLPNSLRLIPGFTNFKKVFKTYLLHTVS